MAACFLYMEDRPQLTILRMSYPRPPTREEAELQTVTFTDGLTDDRTANKADAPNPAMTSLFQSGRLGRRVGYLRR